MTPVHIVAPHLKRILVTINDADILATVETILTNKGFIVDTVLNLEKFAQKLNDNIPDVIMLGFGPPKANGILISKKLKAHPKTANVPIIILTALSERKSLQSSILTREIDFYLMQPFEREDLIEKVEEAIIFGSHD